MFKEIKATSSPITQVVSLLSDLKTRIEGEGADEQKAYDKYACWCEDTLARKATDISDSKGQIESLQTNIVKLGGEIASHAVEVKQLKKDIEANIESQRQAEAIRQKDSAAYNGEKLESEQCIGALEAAIKVLAGAGTAKKQLGTLQEAQLLSVVAGVRGVIMRPHASRGVSGQDMDLVRRFVDHPDQFMEGRTGFLSASQISNNPYGDYAPQSTQIGGILKSMYDSFMADLEKANSEEAKAQESFEKLMETKQAELTTLQASLQQNELDEASKTKQHADDKELLDDTEAQLEADEKLFADTKTNCKAKAGEWAERTRLRTEELAGIAQAIKILSDPENAKVFESATTTFVQLSSFSLGSGAQERKDAYAKLVKVAKKSQSLSLARLAVQLKNGGHFDKIMVTIEKMIELMRQEEQDDIAHKNRCENAQQKNKFDTDDLTHAIEKTGKQLDRLKTEESDLRESITGIEEKINATQADMNEAKSLRIEESESFIQAVKDDTDAIALIEQAIKALAKFYAKKEGGASFAQVAADPEYDQDKPSTEPFSGKYRGAEGEGRGVVAILEMIKEDLQKEIKTGRQDDADAQVMYEKSMGAMRETFNTQTDLKVATEKDIAALEAKIQDLEEFKEGKGNDLVSEEELKQALETDCAWIASHFEDRRTKRKAEVDGLAEAKSYLAGVEAGDQI